MSNSSVAVGISVDVDLEANKQMKANPQRHRDGGRVPVLTPAALTTELGDRVAGVTTA
ncbi:hypothetical protein [Granulicoccus phenolivorans]|uniref:hypothetical protein n=1 Tax=Granulicoccus phenolivorans TaxID=266854 RepID=UPI0012DF4CAA|nr:hypothetical protein [Granulicoccus phenolivorans]